MSHDAPSNPSKKKINKTVTLSPHILNWINSQIHDEVFSSISDAVSVALCELKGRMEGQTEEVTSKETAIEEIRNVSLDAVTAIKKAAVSNENSTMLLLNLLTNHTELVDEINSMIRARHDVNDNKKKTTLE